MHHIKLIAAVVLGWAVLLAIGGRADMQEDHDTAKDVQEAIAAARHEMRVRGCGQDEICRVLVAKKSEN